MVLGGRVNKGLVTLIQQAGGRAVGLCGKDSGIISARQMVEKDIGFVGEVTSVNAALLRTLADDGYIPVVASVASDHRGQALNVNADIAAGEARAGSSALGSAHALPQAQPTGCPVAQSCTLGMSSGLGGPSGGPVACRSRLP